jgi:hypothetical protein
MPSDYVELVWTKGRNRYRVRTPSGLEFTLIAGWRQVTVLFDPAKVDMAILDDDTYRIFSLPVGEDAGAPTDGE